MILLQTMANGFYAEFYGWDVVMYYIYAIRSFMQQYSWQVRFSYGVILVCILTILLVFILFTIRIRQRKRHMAEYNHCYDTYSEAFIRVLEEREPLNNHQILAMCDESQKGFAYYDGFLYAEILTHLRMLLHETVYFPNMQKLCELTGAREALELRLKKRRSIMRSLQMVNTLPLNINEGLLAIYTAHKNPQIAQLARVAYCMCSQTEPYLYFLDDMNKPQSPWYRITIHRILGWKKEQNFPMPPLLMLAQQSENTAMAAFLVEEISYWGTEDEKKQLVTFFNDSRIPCRIAAIRALARLKQEGVEEAIIQTYESQPQVVRRELLKALAGFHTGKYVDFFADIYLNTPSLTSRKIALECLYTYCEEGRLCFEQLSATVTGKEETVLFDQIRTLQHLHAS